MQIVLISFYLRISWFFFISGRYFHWIQNTGLTVLFFYSFKNLLSIYSGLSNYLWGIHCHSNYVSSIGKVLFLSLPSIFFLAASLMSGLKNFLTSSLFISWEWLHLTSPLHIAFTDLLLPSKHQSLSLHSNVSGSNLESHYSQTKWKSGSPHFVFADCYQPRS